MVADKFGLVGNEIDQLRFDAVIDQGGFGLVYRGHHMGLDEPVAIKCLNLNRTLDPVLSESFKQRFRDETKIAYRLSKGNLDIVRSISSGTLRSPAGGALIPYMVLEWLTGQSLAIEIKARMKDGRGPYTIQEVVMLLDPAVTAIAYAHDQGVVHRDIKPGNLFLADTRDGSRVKVLDFGLAKILHPEAIVEPSQETMNGLYICSPSYGAPEQFSSKYGTVGPWSDVYSLALVILELLCGSKARPAKNLQDAIAQIAQADISQPSAARLGITLSTSIDRVLQRALAQHCELRPKDAAAFWNELRDAMMESADDFATISNDQLPGRQIISDALAKAGVKRLGRDSLPPPAPSPLPLGRASVASAQVSTDATAPAPRLSKPPPQEQTVKLDREQLEAFAAKKLDSKRPRAQNTAPKTNPGANANPPRERTSQPPPPAMVHHRAPTTKSVRAKSKPQQSIMWLWIVAALALMTSCVLLYQALHR